jgi:hypothetical protein
MSHRNLNLQRSGCSGCGGAERYTKSKNPPNGSLGIVQVLSKTQRPFELLESSKRQLGIVQVRPIYSLLDLLNCSVP